MTDKKLLKILVDSIDENAESKYFDAAIYHLKKCLEVK